VSAGRIGQAERDRRRARSLWRHAEFMKLWTGETVSQLGTQVTLIALPLTAILVLHANAFQVGVLSAVEFLPFILFGLPAGVWVDRLRRRPVLVAGDILRTLTLGSIPVAYELHHLHIVQLYVVAFLTGIGTVFFDVAYQSYLPSLVERDQLVDGNAKLEISRSGAQLAGPAVGGLLVQLFSAPVAIVTDAVSYLWSAAFVTFIRTPEPHVEVPDTGHPRMRSEIREGLRYVWRHPLLRPQALCTATANLFGYMIMALIVLFAVRDLGLKAGVIGLVFGVGSVGAVLGGFLVRWTVDRVGVGPAVIGSIAVGGASNLLVPLATRSTALPFLFLALFFTGFGGVIYNSNQVGLRQAITPHHLQGKMNATMRFMVWGTIPIGSFVGGVLGKTIGIRPTLWIGAFGGLLAVVPLVLSPVRSLQSIPEDERPVGVPEALAASNAEQLVEPA
jgi:MFS family permease